MAQDGTRPNIVFVFGDQWRAQALGYAGDPNVKTPCLDRLADESVNVALAISGCPICSPYRASLMSGRRPLSHGVFVNDVPLAPDPNSLAHCFRRAGYATAYIGKWHIDAHGRSNYIPPNRRQGFEYWKALECTHAYNRSAYYAGDSAEKRFWEGYDAIAQTRDAQRYIRERGAGGPFLLMLSWGPPHDPYASAPARFRAMYDPLSLRVRPNVPRETIAQARQWLAGYYAHCSALDECAGGLIRTLREQRLEQNTIFVFASDHGDMLGGQGMRTKQMPWDESIRVPFLLRWPERFGSAAREAALLLDAPDIAPTLLGLAGLPVPVSMEGLNFAAALDGAEDPAGGQALIASYHPFANWRKAVGGREYRGLRTLRHTYARTREGRWLLYDNLADPYQQANLAMDARSAELAAEMDRRLDGMLRQRGDEFASGRELLSRWGYETDEQDAVPYAK
ncbi:MAG: Arylsulfatase [candidate division BRC1 bacterium ADurb.BinA364]|nr:MAG: Arylsulfatase [candidate division BRC1 bacterium ADurb.BinA364]